MPLDFYHRLQNILEKFSVLQVAFIYGSFATMQQTEASDIDLALAGYKPLTLDQKMEILSAIEKNFQREVDIVDLQEASGVILSEALTTGKQILLRDPDVLARILSRMVTDEEDFQRQRRIAAKAIRDEVFYVKK